MEFILEKKSLPFRQIHLDFHTSEMISDIANEFQADEFGNILESAHVNQICVFALCHHGWLYYDSKRFPEFVHPNLKEKNLLIKQVEECKRRNIKVPVYISVMWNDQIQKLHPEWLVKNDGVPFVNGTFTNDLCLNTSYIEFLKEVIYEVITLLGDKLDGLFFDIVKPIVCRCESCIKTMQERGIDSTDTELVRKFNMEVVNEFICDLTSFIKKYNGTISVYYNAGGVAPGNRESLKGFTHLEYDALPSQRPIGYKKMLTESRFGRTLGLDCVGQTGKFNTMWGDFGSYKTVSALKYECFKLLSLGAKCLIGDQLLPNGKLDKYAYELIGEVYKEVEKYEPYCIDIEPVVEIGLFSDDGYIQKNFWDKSDNTATAALILERLAVQFDIVDSYSNYSKYKILILPDRITLDEILAERIHEYIKNGGKIIASCESGLSKEKDKFLIDQLGIFLQDRQTTDINGNLVRLKKYNHNNFGDYILCKKGFIDDAYEIPHFMYIKGTDVDVKTEGIVLAKCIKPIHYRNEQYYCSHHQFPPSNEVNGAAVVENGNTIYFSQPIFTIYSFVSPQIIEDMLGAAIDRMIDRKIRHNGPKFLQVTINEQKKEHRYVLHILNYTITSLGIDLFDVEKEFETNNIEFQIRMDRKIKSVTTTNGELIKHNEIESSVIFTVPKIKGMEIVLINVADGI